MDKSWMHEIKWSHAYVDGVKKFMTFVEDYNGREGVIRCPCVGCLNLRTQHKEIVKIHLLERGIDPGYNTWFYHGEESGSRTSKKNHTYTGNGTDNVYEEEEEEDGITEMLFDLGQQYNHQDNDNMSAEDSSNSGGLPLYLESLMQNAQTKLYPGCEQISRISFVIQLLHIKVYNKLSNKAIDMLLKLMKLSFPNGETLPGSYYEAKKILRDLGLGYECIHACKYDCVLFWKENKDLENCPTCGTSRWKSNGDAGKKIAHKVLRYFPLKPRLQRLFMSQKTSEKMVWHKEKRIDDDYMRHPADSIAWKDFDNQFSWYANDPRNVRLALAADGFNPFGNLSTKYSMWPVILTPLNLPPWDCMKDQFLMLSLLIPGKNSPGKDIDVYLQPLVAELKELWVEGIETFDVSSKRIFRMHAAVLWTINDFPAYGDLSGWSTKGYMACPLCNQRTYSQRLRNKLCYMGHRRYLPKNHAWRRSKKFNGKREDNEAPETLTGDEVLMQLHRLEDVIPGKHDRKKRKRMPKELNWTKRSIFFDLPYWSKLKLRHNLDVMHIEKNICENIVGTLLNIDRKTKDTDKGRQDMEDMNIRKELHLTMTSDGKYKKPHACYVMTKKERHEFCEFLKSVKFPDGYASNISRSVTSSDDKISGMKSHDCHVLLQRLLPVGIRGSLKKEVTDVLAELGNFFQLLCCKKLKKSDLEKMGADICLILCKLEMIYPPSFFDVMVHLCIHLPYEALIGGPVQFRWMYPIERFLCGLKQSVRNKAHPEGSIAEAYIAKESLTFCSMYLRGVETRFNRDDRNNDISSDDALSIFSQNCRPFGAATYAELSKDELTATQWFVFQNCEEVKPYFELHKEELLLSGCENIDEEHKDKFPTWFKIQVRIHNINKVCCCTIYL
ncbi:unnamed protein product [Cuscuta epithymum]|uniref:Transposase-associated domain-containing protein n=1 Tax=Cuscuta epithymum TaxID=186058 RepID=A0AAV0EM48_9ASTE|nr:unnamed protein product [Cuscuta epithymum]CAH9124484.1 unnamed protein product [Cuscuta epithymum]